MLLATPLTWRCRTSTTTATSRSMATPETFTSTGATSRTTCVRMKGATKERYKHDVLSYIVQTKYEPTSSVMLLK